VGLERAQVQVALAMVVLGMVALEMVALGMVAPRFRSSQDCGRS